MQDQLFDTQEASAKTFEVSSLCEGLAAVFWMSCTWSITSPLMLVKF